MNQTDGSANTPWVQHCSSCPSTCHIDGYDARVWQNTSFGTWTASITNGTAFAYGQGFSSQLVAQRWCETNVARFVEHQRVKELVDSSHGDPYISS